jgi:hypothetical protein
MTTTTTMTAPVPAHLVAVVSDGFEFLAECSCGWASDWHPTAEAADIAGAEHRSQAVGPGDGLDRVMTGMLDLQDDLAAMVVWLAENWSADLPVPVLYGCGGGESPSAARVEVWVYCGEPALLVRIAQVAGVAPIDDDQPDTYGHRYRNVTRDFGRVTLRAYGPVPRDKEPGS